VKDNHARLREILLQDLLARKGASLKQKNRRHGRVEHREYWWVEADEEMRMYLERELGWPQVRWYGWVKRQRKRLRSGEWSEEEVVWIYGGEKEVTPRQLSQWARGHWEIENCVFWVLDVTYQEDRSHARKIGGLLHTIRCMAINVIRRQGFRYVPDGRRSASARSDRGLAWLSAY
jgi:predicted transposase YbfD/YdcC